MEMGEIYLYAKDFLGHWWPLVSAGSLLGLEEYVERCWRSGAENLKKIPDARRKQARIAALLLASFYSGYLAWDDEHKARLEAESKVPTKTEAPSPYKWPMLTPEETVALRDKIREIDPGPVSVSCAEDDCGDLARSFRDIFDGLHWKVMCCHFPFGGFDPGIHLWAENPTQRRVAHDIEQATNGRLKVDMAEHFTWDVKKYPLQITIGSKP
jgi:hypothetical protein